MLEVSPFMLNRYLSRSYKIIGPTVNTSPMSAGSHYTNDKKKRHLESFEDPAGQSIFFTLHQRD